MRKPDYKAEALSAVLFELGVAGFGAPVASHDVQKLTGRQNMDVLSGALRQDAELPRGRREFAERRETASNRARSRGKGTRPGDAVPQGAIKKSIMDCFASARNEVIAMTELSIKTTWASAGPGQASP